MGGKQPHYMTDLVNKIGRRIEICYRWIILTLVVLRRMSLQIPSPPVRDHIVSISVASLSTRLLNLNLSQKQIPSLIPARGASNIGAIRQIRKQRRKGKVIETLYGRCQSFEALFNTTPQLFLGAERNVSML